MQVNTHFANAYKHTYSHSFHAASSIRQVGDNIVGVLSPIFLFLNTISNKKINDKNLDRIMVARVSERIGYTSSLWSTDTHMHTYARTSQFQFPMDKVVEKFSTYFTV